MLVCDDAYAFSALLSRWIDDADDLEVVADARTPDQARNLAAEHQPDVIVLDHMMRPQTSKELVPSLRAVAPLVSILLISSMPANVLERVAENSRTDGYVTKASSAEEIRAAIRDVGYA